MNSFVNVQVRVLAAQAQAQLAQLNQRIAQLEGSFGKAHGKAGQFGNTLNRMGLDAFGSRVQWAGRQLEYNFTLPIVAASAAAFKLALDNEAAFTRITKVYGDAAHGAQFYSAEIGALRTNFEVLSNAYGVNQSEVLGVAASWAAAGASGLALAKSVDLTMQTMILGEMDATEATQALIAIQAQYGFGVADLTKTIATLNMVENQTGISLMGLVQGFEKAAGMARSTGVDVRHLAAMLAALVPATGSASAAGNALKTIFSRLISPTKETVEVLGLMGIEFGAMSWKSATMTDRLITMAKKFQGLSDAQKGVVSSVAASRWQVNKFEVLMRDLLNTNGYYQRALNATADDTQVYAQMQKELNAVLSSNPRKLQIIWTMLQNAAADIITPMIPLLLWLATAVQRVVQAFSNLPPGVQMGIMAMLAFLAVVGPIIRIGGAIILMVGELGHLFALLAVPIRLAGSALGFLLKFPIMAFLNAMGFMARGAVVALSLMGPGIRTVMNLVQGILLRGAVAAGIAWRAGWGFITTVGVGALQTMYVAVGYAMARMTALMVAGARALGIAWRAGLIGMVAIQRAWGMLMAISWSRVFVVMGAITTGGFAAIGTMMGRFVGIIRAFSGAAIAALTGPWGIAITAVLLLVFAFWDELKGAWSALVRGTVNAFNSLPRGIMGAMQAVVNVVASAVKAVYKLFSYLNPWAHHSPSLVENVTTGMDAVTKQFQRARSVGDIFKRAGMDLAAFGRATAKVKSIAQNLEFAEMRKNLKGVAPGALASFDRLVKVLGPLRSLLASMKPALDAQAATTEKWKNALDAANDALDKQEKILAKLQKVADTYSNQLSEAQARLDGFANAPIVGMKEMGDAIFENEMQQKKLRLELMKMEDAVGPLDKLQSRVEAINGQIEMLRGQQAELRNAGAGSEILSVYDDQIAMLEDQQDAINAQILPLKDLENAIDDLARKGEELDLENSLKFDPLKKQIDDVANAMKELPFDEIMAGVIKNKEEVNKLTEAYKKAQAAVDQQQKIVDLLTARRDAVQEVYDLESKKLEALQKEYDKVADSIRDIEQALQDVGSASDAINRAKKAAKGAKGGGGAGGMSPGAENFMAGAGGNFPDPGGFAQIGREGGIGDQASMIDDFTKEMAKKTADMFGMFNFLDPIKKGWNAAWGWVKSNIGPVFSAIGSAFKDQFSGMNPFEGASTWLDTIKSVGSTIGDAFKMIWDLIGPEVVDLAKSAWKGLQDAFTQIQPEVEKFRELIGPMGEALGNAWKLVKPILLIVLGVVLMVLKAIIRGIAGAIGPVLKGIGALIGGIVRVIRGLIEIVTGIFTGDWKMIWKGVTDIVSGTWKAIWGVISNAGLALWGLVKGIVTGIFDFFVWLYDELVGHSIIPDMVRDIIAWIATLPAKAYAALSTFAAKIVARAKEAWDKFKAGSVAGWSIFWEWLKTRPQAAYNGLVSMKDKLKASATEALNNFKVGASVVWGAISSWFGSRAADAKARLSGMASALADRARSAMDTFKSAFTGKWEGIKDFFAGIGGKVKSAVGNLANILYNIGKSIMQGLLNGIKDAWNDVADYLSGLATKIKNLKGPIEKDRVMLVDEGAAIMQGLQKGMAKEWGAVDNWLGGIAGTIQGTMAASQAINRTLSSENGTSIGQVNRGHAEGYNTGGSTTINLYGNLEFPNISNGNDAEELILNLEAIVRGS